MELDRKVLDVRKGIPVWDSDLLQSPAVTTWSQISSGTMCNGDAKVLYDGEKDDKFDHTVQLLAGLLRIEAPKSRES